MDLSTSQAEAVGLDTKLMGLQVSVLGLAPGGLTPELIVEAMVVTELGTGVNRWGLWVTGVMGALIELVREQSAIMCCSSRYTEYSNMEL